ncbi:MAG: glutamate--tRNA ligase, partial [Pseudomonadota bacterium]
MADPAVAVRFAPSPTGRLHIGNIRSALLNALYAKKAGGTFMLRLDDTDVERSTEAFADGIREDLTWLGLTWERTAKQSDRFERYDAVAQDLKARGLLYACYETPEELDAKRKRQRLRGLPPVYDRSALDLTDVDRAKLEGEGRKPHWRFKLDGSTVTWTDLVRGEVSIDTASISDPVLIRADGTYLYTLPSVIDDVDFGITHIIRGEDHVTNSGAQILVFRALGATEPAFGHHSLMTDASGEGLSKRLGSLSVAALREEGLEPLSILSLLARLGTSDPVEPRTSLEAIIEGFDLSRLSRAPARFDPAELTALNGKILHTMTYAEAEPRLAAKGIEASQALWDAVHENLSRLEDLAAFRVLIEGPIEPTAAAEDADYLTKARASLPEGEMTQDTWGAWTGALKAATGRKGKALFMPLRLALTGRAHGPEMGKLLPLIGREAILTR